MSSVARAFVIVIVFVLTSASWLVLGTVMTTRTSSQQQRTQDRVADLWGSPQTQKPPSFDFTSDRARTASAENSVHPAPPPAPPLDPSSTANNAAVATNGATRDDGSRAKARALKARADNDGPSNAPPVAAVEVLHGAPSSTRINVDLSLDQRLKGLTWYSLYDVGFEGTWSYKNDSGEPGAVRIAFALPDPNAVYDGFHFSVDGVDVDSSPVNGVFEKELTVQPGQLVNVVAGYKSRGLEEWRYDRQAGGAPLHDFSLAMTTNFNDIDFPTMTLSPSTKERSGHGYVLTWRFEKMVSGFGIGMVMPKRIQPGELAAELAFSAPISLFFFFLVLAVLARLRDLDIHPINYFFLGAAFFSFHLLFAYSVDHLPILTAFAISSAASIVMVVSYLRLVVSARFAYREAGLAQLVYLVGFSLAHFLEGFTGITLTVLSVATLFLLMLLTGRIRWSEVLLRKDAVPPSVDKPANAVVGAWPSGPGQAPLSP